jgi:hypothetical protein
MDERREYWSERMKIEKTKWPPTWWAFIYEIKKKNYSQKRFFPMVALDFLYLY